MQATRNSSVPSANNLHADRAAQERTLSLRLVHNAEDAASVEDAMAALAEVTTVMAELRRFVAECRADPAAHAQLTAADLARAKALLPEARGILAYARRRRPDCDRRDAVAPRTSAATGEL